jgi:hypothetical protein
MDVCMTCGHFLLLPHTNLEARMHDVCSIICTSRVIALETLFNLKPIEAYR